MIVLCGPCAKEGAKLAEVTPTAPLECHPFLLTLAAPAAAVGGDRRAGGQPRAGGGEAEAAGPCRTECRNHPLHSQRLVVAPQHVMRPRPLRTAARRSRRPSQQNDAHRSLCAGFVPSGRASRPCGCSSRARPRRRRRWRRARRAPRRRTRRTGWRWSCRPSAASSRGRPSPRSTRGTYRCVPMSKTPPLVEFGAESRRTPLSGNPRKNFHVLFRLRPWLGAKRGTNPWIFDEFRWCTATLSQAARAVARASPLPTQHARHLNRNGRPVQVRFRCPLP